MTNDNVKNDNISLCTKNINNIVHISFFNLLYPLKYTKEAAIGQSEELIHQHVFEIVFKYPSAVNVKTQKKNTRTGTDG